MSDLKPMTAHRALYFMERFKKEEKLLGPNEQAAVDFVIAMLEAQAQPAHAGRVLTDDEIAAEIRSRGQMVNGVKGDGFMQGARWAEQAVLAKRVPMTPEDKDAAMKAKFYPARNQAFLDGIEAAERHHGIVGEKGGA